MSDGPVRVPDGLIDLLSRRPADRPPARALDTHAGSARSAAAWPSGAAWLAGLPALLGTLLTRWDLTPTGEPARHGQCAIVVPVSAPAGAAVLKVGWPHVEARTEHLALQAWVGDGAVRLHRADPTVFALQLERADTRDLAGESIEDACRTVGHLLRRLHRESVPVHPRLERLAESMGEFGDRLAEPDRTAARLPRRYLDQARSLIGSLTEAMPRRVLHTDLHFGNVLASRRADSGPTWLAIDPKPLVGDPAYEVAPALWNRVDELGTGPTLRASARRRVEVICAAAGIDEDRARAWTVVRLIANALDDEGDLGLIVALIKAMGD